MKLQHLIVRNSFRYREESPFKLSSGAHSPFYFDCKKTTLDPEGSSLIGDILYEKVKDLPIAGAGGLTLGADNLASALMYAAFQHKKRIPQLIVRKELKQHGAVKWIEGCIEPGGSVIILDDVVTTGDSVIKAINRVQDEGLKVFGVIVLVDREEFEGMESIRKCIPGKMLEAITTRSEIMDLFVKEKDIPQVNNG